MNTTNDGYSERLVTRITPDVDTRLRLAALVQRISLCHLVTTLLDRGLPTAQELTGQLATKGPAHDASK